MSSVKKKKQPRDANRKVLDGYKKVGATFIPPMVHRTGPWEFVSWSSQIMPELIWWDVLIDRTSPRFAAKVAEDIARHFKPRENRESWWAFITNYSRLSTDDMNGLKEHLRRANVLGNLIEALSDFLNLYPACPISRFLDHPPTGVVDTGYLEHFENRMKDLEHKRSRTSVLVQAQAVYMGFVLGKLRVSKGLALASFPEVERYPDTELSLQVGASICAMVNGLAGQMLPKYSDDAWVQYFWQRSLELRPLDFAHLEKPNG